MLTKKVRSEIAAHVAACLPEEACGLVVMIGRKQVFVPCLNVFEDPTGERTRKDAFTISDMAWMDAEDMGEVVRVVHSHPGQRDLAPSLGDVNGCNGSGITWTIVNEFGDLIEIDPEDPPLVGRRFVLGITDCYGLVMDWHKKNGVNLPDFRVPYTGGRAGRISTWTTGIAPVSVNALRTPQAQWSSCRLAPRCQTTQGSTFRATNCYTTSTAACPVLSRSGQAFSVKMWLNGSDTKTYRRKLRYGNDHV